jgi:hypothetical protein
MGRTKWGLARHKAEGRERRCVEKEKKQGFLRVTRSDRLESKYISDKARYANDRGL